LKAVFITTIVIMSSLVAYLYKKPLEDNYLALVALVIVKRNPKIHQYAEVKCTTS